jgi:DNA (cytosine-5)-methyltransferase 1
MSKKSRLTMIDLFAGCGGLSLGLEQAGFRPLLFSEINKDAANTYLLNRRGENIEQVSDIRSLKNGDINRLRSEWRERGIDRVDLICGGPPCQGYSGIGHRRTFPVEKKKIPSNHLYKEMIRAIKGFEPTMFLFENVRGLLFGRWTPDGKKGEIFEAVYEAFCSLTDYQVRWALLQASDYGVPQRRPRLFIVGIRKKFGWNPSSTEEDAVRAGMLPRGGTAPPELREVLGDLVDPGYGTTLRTDMYPASARLAFQREMRTGRDGRIAPKGAAITEHQYSNHSARVRDRFLLLMRQKPIPEHLKTKKFAQRALRPHWGPEGPNITATSLPDDFIHYCQPRTLTVREWARLQCFPDWYQFTGPRTTGGHRRAGRPDQGEWDRDVPKYTQIGNAVPVRLAAAIGKHLASLIRAGNTGKKSQE